MKTLLKSLAKVSILVLILSSCKMYRNVENLQPNLPKDQRLEYFDVKSLDKLEEGDPILIRSKNDRLYYVTFERVQADSLIGTSWKSGSIKLENNTPFQISVNDILSLKVRRVSAGFTIGGIILVGIITVLIVNSIELFSSGGFTI